MRNLFAKFTKRFQNGPAHTLAMDYYLAAIWHKSYLAFACVYLAKGFCFQS
jgi:hypothetical protein